MPAAYSKDLRSRVIELWQREKLSTDELAVRFEVGSATVTRWKALFRETNSVTPRPHGGGATAKISSEHEPLLRSLVTAHPDWTEALYAEALKSEHNLVASAATVGRAIRRLGYTVKKSALSPQSATAPTSSSVGANTSVPSETSPLRVWFSWTRPARTSR